MKPECFDFNDRRTSCCGSKMKPTRKYVACPADAEKLRSKTWYHCKSLEPCFKITGWFLLRSRRLKGAPVQGQWPNGLGIRMVVGPRRLWSKRTFGSLIFSTWPSYLVHFYSCSIQKNKYPLDYVTVPSCLSQDRVQRGREPTSCGWIDRKDSWWGYLWTTADLATGNRCVISRNRVKNLSIT